MNKQKKLIRCVCVAGAVSLLAAEGADIYGSVKTFSEVLASEGQVILLTPEKIDILIECLAADPNLVIILEDGTQITLEYLETLKATGETIALNESALMANEETLSVLEKLKGAENPGNPTTPGNSGNSGTPGNPGNQTTPGNPSNPVTPGNSGDQTNPENPGNQTNPGNPGNQTTPENPANPVTPGNPGDQTNPGDPANPVTPENPGDQTNPGDPGNPVTPENPGDQTNPENPDGSAIPGSPDESDIPTNPENPDDSKIPGDTDASDATENNSNIPEDSKNPENPDNLDGSNDTDHSDSLEKPGESGFPEGSDRPDESEDAGTIGKPEISKNPINQDNHASDSTDYLNSEENDLKLELETNPDKIVVDAEQFKPEEITPERISNATFILNKDLVKLPKMVEDFRFWTVVRKYAFAKEDIVIKEKIPTKKEKNVRAVGSLKKDGLLYILKEEKDGWFYVESGRVRGFVRSEEVITGEEAGKKLEEYQDIAKKRAKEQQITYTGIEGTAPMAEELIPWKENEAFTYLRATVGQTVAEKKYAVAEKNQIEVKEEKDDSSRVVGVIPKGGLCYVLEGKLEDESELEDKSENETADKTVNESEEEADKKSDKSEKGEGKKTDKSEEAADETIGRSKEAADKKIDQSEEVADQIIDQSKETADRIIDQSKEAVDKIIEKSKDESQKTANESEDEINNGLEQGASDISNMSMEEVLNKTVNEMSNKFLKFGDRFRKDFENGFVEKVSEVSADEDEWVYVESGNVRGFVRKESLSYGKEITKQVEEAKEDSYELAEEKIKPEDNEACYYTLTSTKPGVPDGEIRNSMIEFAAQFIGNPYVWGGTSLTEGADCSGFVQSIYKQYGYNIPRVACDQAEYGIKIPVEDALPGDLIFYAKNGYIHHVVMYAGEGKTIEAMSSKTGIVQSYVKKNSAVWAARILDDNGYEYAGGGISDVNATKDMYGKELGTFKLTYYCACELCCDVETGITATGAPVVEGRTIAVDPKVIPYGTQVIIGGHIFTAEDCGGAIKGNHIDIYVNDHDKASALGVNYANVYLRK